MKKLVVLFMTFITVMPNACFNSTSLRRIRNGGEYWRGLKEKVRGISGINKRSVTAYFYTDELSFVKTWLDTGRIEEGNLQLLLEIASALGFSREDVYNGLNTPTSFKNLLHEIVMKSISLLVTQIQSNNLRFLQVAKYIKIPILPHLEKLYSEALMNGGDEESLSRRVAILDVILVRGSQEFISEFLWRIVTSPQPAITEGERRIALREGLSNFGTFEHFTKLLGFLQSSLPHLELQDLNYAINKSADRHLEHFNNFNDLRKKFRDLRGTPLILRMKDGSFKEVKDVSLIPIFGLGIVEFVDGESFLGNFTQFKNMLAVPVLWNIVSSYIPHQELYLGHS